MLHFVLYCIRSFSTQSLSKSWYLLKLILTTRQGVRIHYNLNRLRKNAEVHIKDEYIHIGDLIHGHPVRHDEYVKSRVTKLHNSPLYKLVKSQNNCSINVMRKLLDSDSDIYVIYDKGHPVILGGNGRVMSFRIARYSGRIQVKVYGKGE